ncbi:MAG: hypothetical protein AAF532_04490 [Planctomycetota bacterium]
MKTPTLAALAVAGTGLALTASVVTAPVAAQTPAPVPPGPAGSGSETVAPAPAMPAEPATLPGASGTTTVVGEPFVVSGPGAAYGYPGCRTCRPGFGFPYAGLIGSPNLLPGLPATTAADAGFNVPNRHPIPYDAVRYWKWNPEVPYGLEGSVHPQVLPIVAVPTDTTQLGYYYQRVPAWRPMPGMIPPPPNPDLIHDRNCRGTAGPYGYVPVEHPFKQPVDDGSESPDGGYGPMAVPGGGFAPAG